MNRKKILIFVVSFFVVCPLFAQTADDAYALYQTAAEYFDAKDYTSAIPYFTKAVPYYKKVYGAKHFYTADVYFYLGVSHSRMGNYQDAIAWLEKAFAIYDSPHGDKASAANTLFEIGYVHYKSENYDDALKCFKNCISRFDKKSQNILFLANSYYYSGACQSEKDDYDSSIASYAKALKIYEVHCYERNSSVANTYNSLAVIYHKIADYATAIRYYEKALELYRAIFDENRSPHIATVYNNLGALYTYIGDYRNAMTYEEKSLRMREQIFAHDSDEIASSYHNLGLIYHNLGNYPEALRHYEEALAIREKIYGESSVRIAETLNNIGIIYHRKGDYNRALACHLRALNIRKQIFGNSHSSLAESYTSIGNVYDSSGDKDAALEYHKKALKIYQTVFGENNPSTVRSYYNIAGFYKEQDLYSEALVYYKKALEIRINCHGEMHPDIADTYGELRKVYSLLGDDETALYYREKELDILSATLGEKHFDFAYCLYESGLWLCQIHEYDGAVEFWEKALDIYKLSFDFKKMIDSLNVMLEISKSMDKPDFRRKVIATAVDTVERAMLDMNSLKSDILRKSLPVYYYGVDFEAQHGNPAKAFEYAEMLRSRGFLDEVGLERAVSLDKVNDDEREQIMGLTAKIALARKEIETQNSLELKDRNEKKLTQAEKDLAAAEKSLAKLDAAIGKRVPQYAQLRNPQPASAKAAQKWCGGDRAILEYVFQSPDMVAENGGQADLKSYCIVITKGAVTAVPLDGGFDYAVAVAKLRESVIPGNARAKPTPESVFEGERNVLYEKLIEPALPYIKGKSRLLIVPDGSLAFLPFDILRKSGDAKMLCEQYAVSLSPSVSVSMVANASRAKEARILAFGGAWYDTKASVEDHRRTFDGSDAGRGANRGFQSTDFSLKVENETQKVFVYKDIQQNGPSAYFRQQDLRWMDLPGTVAELNVLKDSVFPKRKYDERVQDEASEQTVKRLSKDGTLAAYQILHFACHGYFDKTFADLSSILFSEVSDKLDGVSTEDGYLTIPEVSVLSLGADFVCLSACETGLGEVRVGDGMIGLNRAFMVAGARRVGVTLWGVDDEATAEFMASMYKKVERNGMDYEQAYRRTKAEFQRSENYSHPYYWAAFALYE